MVIVRDGYKAYLKTELDARASQGEAYCMAAIAEECSPPEAAYVRDANGKVVFDSKGQPVVDMTKIDPRVPHVGNMGGAAEPHWNEERSALMTSVSKVPGMNAMALFHDQWMIKWDPGTLTTAATIIPAIVLTYTGTGAPYYDHLQKTAVSTNEKDKTRGLVAVSAPLPAAPSTSQAIANLKSAATAGIQTTKVKDAVAFSTETALLSLTCVMKDGTSTSVVVDYPELSNSSCRAVEIGGASGLLTFGAANNARACLQLADERARKLNADGASCFVRSAVTRTDPEQVPPPLRTGINEAQGRALPSLSLRTVGLAVTIVFGVAMLIFGYGLSDAHHRIRRRRAAEP